MAEHRWSDVDRVWHAVLARPESERAAALVDLCAGDDVLRREVESLLIAMAQASQAAFTPAALKVPTELGLTSVPLAGVRLGDRYDVERMVGEGGMANVYLAQDLKHHRRVAIKALKPFLAAALGSDRFLREIGIAARLSHPHILPLHDSGQANGLLYYVMPYVEGESLRDRLGREGRLPVADAVRILKDVVDALAYAHGHHVVHRDIKPGNVMLSGRHALVTDFGVAKALTDATVRDDATSAGAAIGTPQYMAPEQAAGNPTFDHRADVYAVGVLAYELLTGEPPKTSEPVVQRRGDVPAALSDAIAKCLANRPGDRWSTASDLLAELEKLDPATIGGTPPPAGVAPRPKAVGRLALATGAIGVIGAGVWFSGVLGPRKDQKWLQTAAIPEIQRLADAEDFMAAHLLAQQADAALRGDSTLAKVWDGFAPRVTIRSTPSGAKVSWREYGARQQWRPIGETPLTDVRFPKGMYQLRLERAGYRTYEAAATTNWLSQKAAFPLDPAGTLDDSLAHVPGGRFTVESRDLIDQTQIDLGDFLVDRYEVTNRRYQAFVDAGGYRRLEYWRHPFVMNGRTLTWKQAMGRFVDATGRPGPATWELSHYEKGADDQPVQGVSWYEAAAYAAFEGRDLPTIYHWDRAAGTAGARWIVPASNFSADGGPARAGQFAGISRFGAFDMAGNVREWCFNEDVVGTDARFILGGGWNDAKYMFSALYWQSAWDRSATNGFRLVTYLSDGGLERARQPVRRQMRDFRKEKPVADPEFAIYRRMYTYDHTPLNPIIERTESTDDWVRQKITFDAAYGHERVTAYLHLPKHGAPPYQTVVYFPGGSAIFERSIDEDTSASGWEFMVKSGRALLFPVYRGTFERQTEQLKSDLPNETVAYRDLVVQWARDLGRSIDYLETRNDIVADKLAYFGFSWGGRLGGLMLAVEPRFKAAVLHVAGLKMQRSLPEADPFNFVQHVTTPVLMLNGRFDLFFPLETTQIPMFQLLGTPAEHKRQIVYDTGHFVPRPRLAKETLDWLDRYLGTPNGRP